ncbi:RsmD family RNA methyltransferase [Hydrogenobacter thermophilus]|uniref:RsmD family RNA methyltransferase n=1 Tax=Hydrogenobacter thermophilus TaxID=940 RepID=UPI0030F601B4
MEKARRKSKIRPTSSLVKQAVFNILGDIEGTLFIDLFAGTGQMGFMAEERGAKVIFVEKNPKLAKEIEKKTKEKVVISDALKFLMSFDGTADIVFADPPYNYENYQKLIELAIKILNKGGFFILEHSKKVKFNSDKSKVYGDTVLSIWRKKDD